MKLADFPVIIVTPHAAKRWQQRVVNEYGSMTPAIEDAVRKSNLLRKNDSLPPGVPRLPNAAYAFCEFLNVLFVLEILNDAEGRWPVRPKIRVVTLWKIEFKATMLARPNGLLADDIVVHEPPIEIPASESFGSAIEEHDWLASEQKSTEYAIKTCSAKTKKRLGVYLQQLQRRLSDNKRAYKHERSLRTESQAASHQSKREQRNADARKKFWERPI